jgi:hypothetical protein
MTKDSPLTVAGAAVALRRSRTTFPFDLREENRRLSFTSHATRESIDRWAHRRRRNGRSRTHRLGGYVRPRGRWAWAHAAVTSRGGASRRLIGVSSPEAETIAVSSRRQRGHTKRTSCGDADQLERFTLAAIGQASQCEHDTRNRPGSSIPIPSDSASCPPSSNDRSM